MSGICVLLTNFSLDHPCQYGILEPFIPPLLPFQEMTMSRLILAPLTLLLIVGITLADEPAKPAKKAKRPRTCS